MKKLQRHTGQISSIIVAAMLCFASGCAQRTDGEAQSVVELTNGDLFFAGNIQGLCEGDQDLHLVKTAANGRKLWGMVCGGEKNEEAVAVAEMADGDLAVLGTSTSYGAGAADLYLLKTSAIGELKWSKTFGGTGSEAALGMVACPDGGLALLGNKPSSENNVYGPMLMKLNAQGDMEWEQPVPSGRSLRPRFLADGTFQFDIKTLGSILIVDELGSVVDTIAFEVDEVVVDYVLEPDDSVVMTGNLSSDGADFALPNGIYLAKQSGQGEILWNRSPAAKAVHFIEKNIDGGYLIFGETCKWGWDTCEVNEWRTPVALSVDAEGHSLLNPSLLADFSGLYIYPVDTTACDGGGVIAAGSQTRFSILDMLRVLLFLDDDTGKAATLLRIDEHANRQWGKTYPESGTGNGCS
jgi:hypothetical protein